MTREFDLDDTTDLALKNRSELIDIIHSLINRINVLEDIKTMGWRSWKFEKGKLIGVNKEDKEDIWEVE